MFAVNWIKPRVYRVYIFDIVDIYISLWKPSSLTPINLQFYWISHTILGARLAFDQIELNVCQLGNKITQKLAFVNDKIFDVCHCAATYLQFVWFIVWFFVILFILNVKWTQISPYLRWLKNFVYICTDLSILLLPSLYFSFLIAFLGYSTSLIRRVLRSTATLYVHLSLSLELLAHATHTNTSSILFNFCSVLYIL